MIAKFFRFLDNNGQPTGYVGLACARSMDELFWTIDEFGDPCRIEIMAVKNGATCHHQRITGDQDDAETERTCHEFSERFPEVNDDGWKPSPWKDGFLSYGAGETK